MTTIQKKKNLFLAYFYWIVGGWAGLHLIYLERDMQAFVYWWSLGGYLGVGILYDFFRIPTYVKDINEEKVYMIKLISSMREKKKPNWSVVRLTAQCLVGNMWYLLAFAAVPQEDKLFGVTIAPLAYVIAPFFAALGVWAVGNIGRECGSPIWAIVGSYSIIIPFMIFGANVLNWSSVTSTICFNKYSKNWRRTPYKRERIFNVIDLHPIAYWTRAIRRVTRLSVAWLVFGLLLVSFLYFNATIESNNEKIKLRDAAGHFYRSPMFQQFLSNLHKVCNNTYHEGFSTGWQSFVELLDVEGRLHALEVLGVEKNATQEEIKEKVKELVRIWHPDKHHDELNKKTAEQFFVEIQRAADVLLDSKRRRKKSNQRFS